MKKILFAAMLALSLTAHAKGGGGGHASGGGGHASVSSAHVSVAAAPHVATPAPVAAKPVVVAAPARVVEPAPAPVVKSTFSGPVVSPGAARPYCSEERRKKNEC